MSAASLGTRFMESTRGQIVSLLRRSARTVEELAGALGLTNNAIRNHLATLERDGIVRQEGIRRGPGAGKPATVAPRGQLHPRILRIPALSMISTSPPRAVSTPAAALTRAANVPLA